MKYFLETEYLNEYTFPGILRYTLQSLLLEGDMYQVRIIASKNINNELQISGKVSSEILNTSKKLVNWIIENSLIEELFYLIVERNYKSVNKVILSHPDDTCCWFLELSESEFKEFQNKLSKNQFPPDLFYDERMVITKKAPGLLGHLGFKKTYTPKQFDNTIH